MAPVTRRTLLRWFLSLFSLSVVCTVLVGWLAPPGRLNSQDADGLYDYFVSILRTPRPDIAGGASRPTIEYDGTSTIDYLPLLRPEYGEHLPYLTLPPALTSSPTPPALAIALHAFLSRPVLSHGEYTSPEHAEWTAQCPRQVTDRTSTVGVTFDNHDWWYTVGKNMIRSERVGVVKRLEQLIESGVQVTKEHKGGKKTRGLVFTGGNKDTTARLITLLRILRTVHGCTLPAEVFLYPEEMTDPAERELIESMDAKLVPVEQLKKDHGSWKDYQIKGLAMVQSSFDEILYLDSDNIPLRDPSYLFDSKRYNAPGSGRAVFWPDLSKDHVDNAIWRFVGDPCTLDHWTFESGQILIDKTGNDGLNLAALYIAAYMQEKDHQDFYFKMCGGDKDTYRWAFRILDIPFTVSPRWATTLGSLNEEDNNRFCGHTILQYDLDIIEGYSRELPLFVHSNLLKHMWSHLGRGKTFTHLRRMSLDAFDEPTLNHAHMFVYNPPSGVMCTDVELWDDGGLLTEDERKVQFVLTEELGAVEGNPFEGFEDSFYDYGGRVGGW